MHWVRNSLIGIVILLVAGVVFYGLQDPAEQLPVNTRLGGDYQLTDQNGETFDSSTLRGQVVLMFFGFTHCPDICPATMARMSHAWRMLDEDGDGEDVALVFVTFDPVRDTPEHLRKYLTFFGDNVIGLTGTEAQVRKVAEQYGVIYLQESDDESGDYGFSHSDFIYLLDAQGRVRALYKSDVDIDLLVKDARSLL